MINQEDRVGVGSCITWPRGSTEWMIIDYDTNRWVVLEGPAEVYDEDDSGLGTEQARKTMESALDELDHGVVKITVDAKGEILSRSTSRQDDITPLIHYPPFEAGSLKIEASQIVRRDELVEQDRLQGGIDVVESSHSPGKMVFKYTIKPGRENIEAIWNDAFITQQLSGHRNTVPFQNFVTDHRLSAFLGFTTVFFPRKSLDMSGSTTIRRHWLQEMMNFLDELNFKHGIIHQDIALRNFLIDEQEDCLRLCDFASAARSGSPEVKCYADDGKMFVFSVYQLLTGDTQYVKKHPSEIEVESVVDMKAWPSKQGLILKPGTSSDHIRKEVIAWVQRRSNHHHTHPQSHLTWPSMPESSVYDGVPRTRSETQSYDDTMCYRLNHVNEMEHGQYVIRWERPSFKALKQEKKRDPLKDDFNPPTSGYMHTG